MYNEIEKSNGALVSDTLPTFCNTVCINETKMRVFASILLKSSNLQYLGREILQHFGK